MRIFDLLNLQHVVLFLFPTLVFIVLFGMALARAHFRTTEGEKREKAAHDVFPDDIRIKRSPFPLVLTLIIVGTLVWGILYILISGLIGRRI